METDSAVCRATCTEERYKVTTTSLDCYERMQWLHAVGWKPNMTLATQAGVTVNKDRGRPKPWKPVLTMCTQRLVSLEIEGRITWLISSPRSCLQCWQSSSLRVMTCPRKLVPHPKFSHIITAWRPQATSDSACRPRSAHSPKPGDSLWPGAAHIAKGFNVDNHLVDLSSPESTLKLHSRCSKSYRQAHPLNLNDISSRHKLNSQAQ